MPSRTPKLPPNMRAQQQRDPYCRRCGEIYMPRDRHRITADGCDCCRHLGAKPARALMLENAGQIPRGVGAAYQRGLNGG